jgi:hypothetical protein
VWSGNSQDCNRRPNIAAGNSKNCRLRHAYILAKAGAMSAWINPADKLKRGWEPIKRFRNGKAGSGWRMLLAFPQA